MSLNVSSEGGNHFKILSEFLNNSMHMHSAHFHPFKNILKTLLLRGVYFCKLGTELKVFNISQNVEKNELEQCCTPVTSGSGGRRSRASRSSLVQTEFETSMKYTRPYLEKVKTKQTTKTRFPKQNKKQKHQIIKANKIMLALRK